MTHCTFDLITDCMITEACFAYRRISANTTCLYSWTRAIPLSFISIFTVGLVSKYSLSFASLYVSLHHTTSPPFSRQLSNGDNTTEKRERRPEKKIKSNVFRSGEIKSFGITKSRHSNSSITMTVDRKRSSVLVLGNFQRGSKFGMKERKGEELFVKCVFVQMSPCQEENKGCKDRREPM